jgi:hypothetical protein
MWRDYSRRIRSARRLVCDAAGNLLRMLSDSDLLRPFAAEIETRRTWWLRLSAEGTDLAPEFLNNLREDQRRAKDLVITVTERTSVRESPIS